MNLKFNKIEPFIFYAAVLLNMLPVLPYKFFPTMDGAAHLYNSNLINELLFNSNSDISNYFILNSIPVPNWLGHFVLSVFNYFLPAFIAEKILLLSYLLLLPLSFRCFVKQYGNQYLSYLILPFCYSYLFYLGFYNLSISLILLFTTLSFWKKHEAELTLKPLLVLFFLISLTYFAHVLVYMLLLVTLFLLLTQSFISQLNDKNDDNIIRSFLIKYFKLYIISFPTILLLLFFIYNEPVSGSGDKLAISELIKWIKDVRPLIALGYDSELRFTEIYYHLLFALFVVALFLGIQNFKAESPNRNLFRSIINKTLLPKNAYFFVAFFLLILYFLIPNSGSAGMMSDRLCLMFFVFCILWLAVNSYPQWLMKVSIIIVLYVNFGLVVRYTKATVDLNKDAKAIYAASKHIRAYSTVLPINNADNWLEPHFSNYLGIDNPIFILENYEAGVGWFPVKWNEARLPLTKFGSLKNENLSFSWKSGSAAKEKIIDYVFIWGTSKKLSDAETAELDKYYSKTYSSDNEFVNLYELKKEFR